MTISTMDITLIFTGGILIGCLLGLSWFAGSDAPYVATKTGRIKRALLAAGLKKGDIFWELGSGVRFQCYYSISFNNLNSNKRKMFKS